MLRTLAESLLQHLSQQYNEGALSSSNVPVFLAQRSYMSTLKHTDSLFSLCFFLCVNVQSLVWTPHSPATQSRVVYVLVEWLSYFSCDSFTCVIHFNEFKGYNYQYSSPYTWIEILRATDIVLYSTSAEMLNFNRNAEADYYKVDKNYVLTGRLEETTYRHGSAKTYCSANWPWSLVRSWGRAAYPDRPNLWLQDVLFFYRFFIGVTRNSEFAYNSWAWRRATPYVLCHLRRHSE